MNYTTLKLNHCDYIEKISSIKAKILKKLGFNMKYIHLLIITLALHSGILLHAKEDFTIDLSLSTDRGNVLFEIHGDDKDLVYMLRVKEILKKQALPILNYFEYVPTTAIHFVINKQATSANGSATVFPRNLITLNSFPPVGNGHLITGEDWLVGLVLHELVHIAHLDQTSGIPDFLRKIFGSVAKWGGIVPRWFSEGIAMWAETEFTQGGRLRQDMLLYEFEARFSDPDFCQTIDCLDSPGKYPYGAYPYWIGGMFMNWIEQQKEGNIRCLVQHNSKNIPFILNDAFNACLGQNASKTFATFRASLIRKIKAKDRKGHPLANGKKKIRFSTKETPLFQKGWQVINNQMVFIQDSDRVENLTFKDLATLENQKKRLPFHIDQVYALSQKSDKLILNSSTYHRYTQKRKVALLDTKTQEIETFEDTGEYPGIPKSDLITLDFKDFNWKVFRNDEVIYEFPPLLQVNTVRYHNVGNREFMTAKVVNPHAADPYQLWTIELGGQDAPSKVHKLWESSNPYHLLLSCDGRHLLREKETLIEASISALDQKLIRKVNLPWSKEIVQIRGDQTNTVVLLSHRPGFAYIQNQSCDEILDEFFYESNQARPKLITSYIPTEKTLVPPDEVSSYPRASHFLPHWWAFSYYAGAQLANWQINTSVQDPRNKHNISFALKYFPDLEEATPSGVYNYNYGVNNIGFGYDRNYINSSLKITPDLNESKFVYLSRTMSRWGWTLVPRLSHNMRTTKDIFGKRNITNTALYTLFYKEPLFVDSFFKSTMIYANGYYEDIENLASFWANEFKIIETLQPFRRFYLHLQGTYAKLYNDSFLEGVVYSGGFDDYSVSAFHPFYGISVNDAYGREVMTYRAQIDATISESFRGIGLVPVFIKTLSFLAGYEYLKTDRIFISESKKFIRDGDVTGAHIGLRARTTIGYFIPVEFDTIFNQTNNPVGQDYTSMLFLLKASFFL